MTDKNISTQEKWDTIYSGAEKQPKMASEVLRDNQHLLPTSGKALDFACGLGANALLLAAHGLETHAWDISEVAVTRLAEEAAAQGLHIQAEARDLVAQPPEPESFDVIVSCHFLERPLNPRLLAALLPGGLLFYQTFTLERVDGAGPQNPEFRLHENELLTMFPGLRVLVYREEGLVGDTQRGLRSRAMLVAQKRL